MELKWLQDFLALAECGSFSKAAARRSVTQPAFSRRIRSLEHWLGVTLIDRAYHPAKLTSSGQTFKPKAEALVNDMLGARFTLQQEHNRLSSLLVLSQHTLAVAFFPRWYQQFFNSDSSHSIRLVADNLHDAVEMFFSGQGDFLLCYAAQMSSMLSNDKSVFSCRMGVDHLIAVASPQYAKSLAQSKKLKLLEYPLDSFFGEIVHKHCLTQLQEESFSIQAVYENSLAEGLKAMALIGAGVAWLPKSLIEQELECNDLTILGEPFMQIDLDINLYRNERLNEPDALLFWQRCLELTEG